MVDQYKDQLDTIMRRELSRGEFIKVVGVALLGFIGVASFFKNLHEGASSHGGRRAGYGASPYGR